MMKKIILNILFGLQVIFCYTQNFFIYPPVNDTISISEIRSDTTFKSISCHLEGDSFKTYFIHGSRFDYQSVNGWVIVRSWWQDEQTQDSVSIFGKRYKVDLNVTDSGYEIFYEQYGVRLKNEIQGIPVCTRLRPILIVNVYTCQVFYIENEALFHSQKKISLCDGDGW